METTYKHVANASLVNDQHLLLRRIRQWTVLFVVFLILSGLTAFPVQTELNFLIGFADLFPDTMRSWLISVTGAVNNVAGDYPFLFYGYDWLAYSHIVIALFFYGVYKNPVQNAWVIRVGMIACLGVFILAMVCGPIRGIPFFWTIIDFSFGAFGLIPLVRMLQLTKQFETIQKLNTGL
ncbi:MAG TPA: hypothetical protein VI731_00370 [Bacteroidia bacterium]|nr:hypothetical protein [Bacteroidia bacterium]